MKEEYLILSSVSLVTNDRIYKRHEVDLYEIKAEVQHEFLTVKYLLHLVLH